MVNLTSLYINENKLDLAVSTGEQAAKANARFAPALTTWVSRYTRSLSSTSRSGGEEGARVGTKMAEVR